MTLNPPRAIDNMQHPNSRANLIEWRPGQSGNPSGRAKYSRSPAEYLRDLQAPAFTVPVLRKIARSAKEPIGRRAAARQLLAMLVDENADLDERVEARRALAQVNDRLEGTPTQSHRVVDEAVPDVVQVVANLRAELVGGDLARQAAQVGPVAVEAAEAGQVEAVQAPHAVDAVDAAEAVQVGQAVQAVPVEPVQAEAVQAVQAPQAVQVGPVGPVGQVGALEPLGPGEQVQQPPQAGQAGQAVQPGQVEAGQDAPS